MLSVVVPCFNEEETVKIFYDRITQEFLKLPDEYEIIFVDDGSTDLTAEKIKELREKDKRVQYLLFSRNFGKEGAILAGFEKAKGEYTALLDVDLQDPVELIIPMYKGVKDEGYDSCGARRVSRKGEPPIRSMFAKMFYFIMQKILKINVVDGARDFRLMNRRYLNAVLSLHEKTRFSKALMPWVGFKTKYFEFENVERVAGETKWSFKKLLLYALDGIFAFSDIPLHLISAFGTLFFILSIVISLGVLGFNAIFDGEISGKTLICSIVLFTAGVQMLCFSVLGQYVAKIYTEVKGRPQYIVREES